MAIEKAHSVHADLEKSSSYFEFPASPKCYLKSKQKTGLFKGLTLFTPEVICAKHDVIMRRTYKTGDRSYAQGMKFENPVVP